MGKRLLSLGLVVLIGNVLASQTDSSTVESQVFQKFDNQFYIGMGTSYGNLTNAYGQNSNYGTTSINFGFERLFDIGLWLRFDGSMLTGYSNFNSTNPNALTGPLGQNPSVGNMDAKLGYAFMPLAEKLLVTPYLLFGRNTNLTSNSLNNNQTTTAGVQNLTNVTQDYFLTLGVGARLEYRLNQIVAVYFDQNALYNSDQSTPNANYASASNYQLVSTLGAKFNVWQSLQLGIEGFYSYNQLSNGVTQLQQYQFYPQNQVGGMATIGLTY